MRLLILSTLMCVWAGGAYAQPAEPKAPTVTVHLDRITINDWIVPTGSKLADFEKLLGKPSRSRSAENIIFYIWDGIGLELREQQTTKLADQLTVYLRPSGADAPSQAFSGKLRFVQREVSTTTAPQEFAPVQKCRGIFCMISVGNNKVFAMTDMQQSAYTSILISLP